MASLLLLIALPAVMVVIPVALPRCSPAQARIALIAVGALWLATFALIIARS